jgi:hypothetical protein
MGIEIEASVEMGSGGPMKRSKFTDEQILAI